ncbi:universal stress protein [Zeaxanthinibacter enoshimensis]|uniref:Nucleotide-binding universal stress UspA family protein n=1 Tax=Zeaxanthinibacter enoshimensis TaxID=392009 RepID=A0A4R6TMJ5_9FLAO|nr:universal stress protein [Zeaxanthinibacter enoshimensis]TDQ30885.1 nucleotide-binding universal stress UspA family protein [Zeaxanthinibacter enoshimensis]
METNGTIKNILVPVDFSPHSEYALEVAANMARENNSDIFLFHMLGLAQSVLLQDYSQKEAEAEYYMKMARDKFKHILESPRLKGIEVKVILQNYKRFEELNNVVRENAIDLVVMGSHGTSGVGEIFVGSNTEKVVRTITVPVLVIKERVRDFNPRTVVMAIDYRKEQLDVYARAIKWFSARGCRICLLHVNLPNMSYSSTARSRQRADDFLSLAHPGGIPEHIDQVFISDYSLEQGLYYQAQREKADIIAVLTHGRKGLAHFFMGSIGEDLVNHAPIPVMTFRM